MDNTQLPADVEYMPILSVDTSYKECPKQIPMSMLDEQTTQHNHGQSLKRLKARGGLGVHEALAIMDKKHWKERNHYSISEAIRLLNEKVSAFFLKNKSRALPAEWLEEIKYEAEEKAEQYFKSLQESNPEGDLSKHLAQQLGYRKGYREAHAAYATKAYEAQQENEALNDLVGPIEMLQNKHNAARALLEKFISRHEACFVVDKELYNEIKTFLDGTL